MKTVLLILVLSFFMYDLSAQQDLSIKKAQELSWRGNYKESISEYDKVLAKDPKNLAALEGKADVLSWMGDFDGSIKAYDELLEQKFISNASRKKARVLAWGQRFNDSMDAYKASYQDSDDEATKHEMFGKKSWWDGRTKL